jgi:surface protein
VQSAPGECFDCPGYFASTTDTSIKFYDGCGGTQIPAPFDINVTAHYSDASTQTTFIPSGTTGSVLIATSDVQCVAPPTCGETASPTFDYADVVPIFGSISECCVGPTPTQFITTWDTTYTIFNSSNSNQVRLPLQLSGTYNFTVNWGDGNTDTITTWNQAETLHTYSTPGVYTITIDGICNGFSWGGTTNSNDFEKLLTVIRWGNVNLGNSGNYFGGCVNLDLSAVQDVPNLSGITTFEAMFLYCYNLTTINNINLWDVSNITNMSGMFSDATSFNQSLNSWNVSNVTEMSSMFANAYSFNGNITSWNVSSVTQFQVMFSNATVFNQNIGSWNVSSAQNMSFMFDGATAFNQNIGGWNISNVLFINDFMLGKSSANYSTTNLNAIYNGWSSLSVQPALSIGFGTIKYTAAGQAGRNILTGSPNNWTITDGGI